MKTKKIIYSGIFLLTFGMLFISACKKKETPEPIVPPVETPTDNPAQQTQKAKDQSSVDDESNRAMNEANSAMQEVSTTRMVQVYCNMTVDSSQKQYGIITLNYYGNDCNNITNRTGSISIQLPYSATNGITRWSTAGSKATLTYNNYKVIRLADNKSLTFNGTHSITNVNGGGYIQMFLGQSLVHKIRGNMQLTFDDSTSRNWQTAQLITYTYNANTQIAKASIVGDTILSDTTGIYNNVTSWGTNRFGDSFIADMPTPFTYNVYGSPCLYKPLTGKIIFYGNLHSLTLTYGVDASGTAVTTGCPYGYKFSWTNALGNNQQVVLSY